MQKVPVINPFERSIKNQQIINTLLFIELVYLIPYLSTGTALLLLYIPSKKVFTV